jgi:hypothetical protein
MWAKLIRYEVVKNPEETPNEPLVVRKTDYDGKVTLLSVVKARVELMKHGWKFKETDVLLGRIITIPFKP